ncbi:4631_t:CDS:10 [Paraglomus occultum]|uniref:Actin cytoskeleton-regulatory complex protein PAN1 n=1 Tax=Paraglomus occultum TaxID=144539 RepID=A0A9N9FCM7_9GLOM|nr:4631_t:CDS:10 [Paraglomus occultum]
MYNNNNLQLGGVGGYGQSPSLQPQLTGVPVNTNLQLGGVGGYGQSGSLQPQLAGVPVNANIQLGGISGYGQPPLQPQLSGNPPASTGGGPHIPNVRLSFISAKDQTKFEELYRSTVAGGKYMTAEQAKAILIKSKLSPEVLAKIWNLSDITQTGYLTFPEFALAMYLTNHKLNGREIPSTTPDNILSEVKGVIGQIQAIEQKQVSEQPLIQMNATPQMSSVQPPMVQQQYTGMSTISSIPTIASISPVPTGVSSASGLLGQNFMMLAQRVMPQQNPPLQYNVQGLQGNAKIPWAVTNEEKMQYREIFKAWDVNGSGYLSGEKAREIFSQTGLPRDVLMQIWHLADPYNHGKLNIDEFAVAMHLIYRKLNGYDVPATLPPELMPPSSRDLAESVDKLTNIIVRESQAQRLSPQPTSNQYTKSRSFNVGASTNPLDVKQDAVAYKHDDDDVGYVSSARRRAPLTTPKPETKKKLNLEELRKQVHEKEITLDALLYSAESIPTQAYSERGGDDIEILKRDIRDLHSQIIRLSPGDSVSREQDRNFTELRTLLDDHRRLESEMNDSLSSTIPDLIKTIRKTDDQVAEAKLALFKLRDTKNSGSTLEIIGTGPGGTITEADRIKAKAQAMVQARLAALTGKPVSTGGTDADAAKRFEEKAVAVNAERATREERVAEIERTVARIQDMLIRFAREKEEISDVLRHYETDGQISYEERRKWEDGIDVGDEVRRFIDELRREGESSTNRYLRKESDLSTTSYLRKDSDYLRKDSESSTSSYLRKESELSTSSYSRREGESSTNSYLKKEGESSVNSSSTPPSSGNSFSLKPKTPEERAAFIQAEAERRMQESLRRLGLDPSLNTSKSSTLSVSERLARERAEAEERERARTEKLLADKQRKAEENAERERRLEEYKRQEEARKAQWLAEAEDLEKANVPPPAPPPPPVVSTPPIAPPPPPVASTPPVAPTPPPVTSTTSAVSTPPVAPPPPTQSSSLPPSSDSRNALLSQIRQGARLKATVTNDRSSPAIGGQSRGAGTSASASASTSSSSPAGAASSPLLAGLGGLFAGGFPRLASRSGTIDTGRTAETNSSNKSEVNRRDTEWYDSLASDTFASNDTYATKPVTVDEKEEEKEKETDVFGDTSERVASPITTNVINSEENVDFEKMHKVKSLYAFAGTGPDDLPFEAGTVFKAYPSKEDKNPDWWFGIIEETGTKGWLPKNYVEDVTEARVLYDYAAQTAEELTIKKDSVVIILDKSLGHWWKVEHEGAKGFVPANYVEEISSSSDSSLNLQDSSVPDDNQEIVSDPEDPFNLEYTDDDVDDDMDSADEEIQKRITRVPSLVIRSASPDRMDGSRTPSPTRLFGSSPISSVSWIPSRHRKQSFGVSSELGGIRPKSPVGLSSQSWASLIPPSTLATLSKQTVKRQEAIHELVLTEQSYLCDLQMIIQTFYSPLQSRLSSSELTTLFANIDDILLVNTALLSDLEQRQEEGIVVECIGDVFLKHADNLTCYIEYCGNQMNASKFLIMRRSADRELDQFLKKQQQEPQCRNLDLSSFLLQPMQRITRYPLLLRQILHYTEKDHTDHENMMQALKKAESVLEETDEAIRDQENKLKIAEITKIVDFETLGEKLELTSMTKFVGKRQYIMEGPLQKAKSSRKLYGYLFNDMLILCEQLRNPSRGYKYTLYRPPIPLNEIVVKDGGSDKISFQLTHNTYKINLRTNNVSVKRQWVNNLETASGYCQRKAEGNPIVSDYIGTLKVLVYEAYIPNNGLYANKPLNLHCRAQLSRQIFKTKSVKDTLSPKWNQALIFSVATLEDTLRLSVYNSDGKSNQDEYMGQASIRLNYFLKENREKQTDAIKLSLKDGATDAHISVSLTYKPT